MVRRVTIVLALWCPHCHPLSLDKARQMAEEMRVELQVLDIDKPDQVTIADELVKEHGDFSEDYLIPQVFVEWEDGRPQHILTGFSEGVDVTRKKWDDFFESHYYREDLLGSARNKS